MKRRFNPNLRLNPNLIVFSIGLLAASSGAAWIYPPAGLIVAGLVLMTIALFGEQK